MTIFVTIICVLIYLLAAVGFFGLIGEGDHDRREAVGWSLVWPFTLLMAGIFKLIDGET